MFKFQTLIIMKKYYLKLQVIISALLLLVTAQSCRKETSHKQHCGHLIPIETDAKTGNQYLLICFLGHDAANFRMFNDKWEIGSCGLPRRRTCV